MANEFRIKNGLIVSGNATVSGIVLDGNTITGIDDSGEFTDNDAHIMTSAGINDKFGLIAGSSSIVTVGTITTGTWNGTAIASAYLDADTAHLSGTQTFSGNKTFSGSITLGGHAVNDIDVAGEFVDSDEHLMTSAAINDRIAAAGGGASDLDGLSDAKSEGTNFTGSLLIGHQTHGTLSSASHNTGVGIAALDALTSGDRNTALGHQALSGASGGSDNTAVGKDALLINNNHGSVAVGAYAGHALSNSKGYSVIVGSYFDSNAFDAEKAVAIGRNALFSTTADYTVGIGSSAGYNLTSGSGNILIGKDAGYNLGTGARNIAVGYQALDASNNESDNIAIGYDALGGSVAGGEKNVGIGNYSLDALTSADHNVAIGYNAGGLIQDGGSNVVIGSEAAGNGDIGANNVLVGMQSGYGSTDATQSVAIGNDAGKFGLKAATGSIAMGQNALKGHSSNTTGANYNTALGHYSMEDVTTGDDNTAVGSYTLKEITTGSTNIAIGHDAGDNITTGSHNVVVGGADVASATGDSQLSISSGNGGVTWITGTSDSGVLMGDGTVPNGSTAGQLTISNANADTFAHTLLLVDSENDATNGPVLTLYRNTSSPADNDILGKIQFNGEDSNGDARAYGNIRTESVDVTNGSHDGAMIFNTAIAGTQTDIFRIDTGVRAMIAGVVNITGTTTLSDEQSGSYVYVTGSGAPTLPPTAIAGQQFTLINNTGGNLTVGLGTSNAIASGWTAHAVMADETARTYFSPEANKWIYIG